MFSIDPTIDKSVIGMNCFSPTAIMNPFIVAVQALYD